jgi:hypothetical protein
MMKRELDEIEAELKGMSVQPQPDSDNCEQGQTDPERDALRAEVEKYKRAALTETIDKLLCHVPMPYNIQAEIKAWRDRQIERRKAQ